MGGGVGLDLRLAHLVHALPFALIRGRTVGAVRLRDQELAVGGEDGFVFLPRGVHIRGRAGRTTNPGAQTVSIFAGAPAAPPTPGAPTKRYRS